MPPLASPKRCIVDNLTSDNALTICTDGCELNQLGEAENNNPEDKLRCGEDDDDITVSYCRLSKLAGIAFSLRQGEDSVEAIRCSDQFPHSLLQTHNQHARIEGERHASYHVKKRRSPALYLDDNNLCDWGKKRRQDICDIKAIA
jgi:hypothetical protein